MKKVAYITGTRADYGLMSSVLKEINSSKDIKLTVIATGMHLMPEYGSSLRQIRKDGYNIKIINAKYEKDDLGATPKFMGEFMAKLTDVLLEIQPDIIMVLGDRAEALAGAIAGQYLNIAVAHISGGDTSGHVDDATRNAITKLAHIHFPITRQSAKRLISMGENAQRIFVVGSTSLDALRSKKMLDKKTVLMRYSLKPSPYALVLQHPVISEIDKTEENMRKLLDALVELKLQSIIIYPNADAGGKKIINAIKEYKKYRFLQSFANAPYEEYLSLMKHAAVIAGNSSSGIVESAFFGIPAVNIGTRQQGRERAGNVVDADYDKEEIMKALKKALFDDRFKQKCRLAVSPYQAGSASKLIMDIINRLKIGKFLLDKKNDCRVIRPDFKRFRELKPSDINFDFHMHTMQSDGNNSAQEMISHAEKLHLKAIAITDHVRKDSNWFKGFKQKVEKLRKRRQNGHLKVLIGIEAKSLGTDGNIDAPEDALKDADIVIGSVHRYSDKGRLIPINEIGMMGKKKAAEIEFKLALGMVKNKDNHIDVLGHPFGVYSKFFDDFPEEYIGGLMKEALKNDVAIEISTKYHLNPKFFRLLGKINPYVSLASDAHQKSDIARSFDAIVAEIRK